MRWVRPVRALGAVTGLLLIAIGAQWLLSGLLAPPTGSVEVFALVGLSLLIPGVLLVVPWSRIRRPAIWYPVFVAFVLLVPPGVLLIFAVNTWSMLHGAGGQGFALLGLLLGAWAIQLPAIWALRPKRDPRAPWQ